VLCVPHADAQRGRRGGGGAGAGSTGPKPLRGVVIAIHGQLKEIKKKEITVQADDGKVWTLRRSSKTKFYREEKEIKPFEIDLDSVVTADISEDNDLKFQVLTVKAEPKEKRVLKVPVEAK